MSWSPLRGFWLRTLSALAALTAGSSRAIAEPAVMSEADFISKLETINKKHKLPGLAAAAWVDGKVTHATAVGVRRRGNPTPVAVEDRWHIGSCTKSMTAALAAMLVEDGKLKWESTVGEILGSTQKPTPEWQAITLEALLQHRAGAPGEPPDDLWETAWKRVGTPREQRAAFVRGLFHTPPVGKGNFEYSNQGYAIAGSMLETAAGRPWEELLAERLFAPLGMKSAGFGAPGRKRALDQPLGHSGTWRLKPEEPGPDADNPPAIGPAGTVHCSIRDLARYAGWHAERCRGGDSGPRLKRETAARLHTPPSGGDYALGWIVLKREWARGQVLMHNGSNTMWYGVMWIAPERKAAFVAATNCAADGADKACDEAVSILCDRLLKP